MCSEICGLTLAPLELHVFTSARSVRQRRERHFQTDELDVIFHRWSRKVIRYKALSGMGVEVVCQSQGGFPVSRSDAL